MEESDQTAIDSVVGRLFNKQSFYLAPFVAYVNSVMEEKV